MRLYEKDFLGDQALSVPPSLDRDVKPGLFRDTLFSGNDVILPRFHRWFDTRLTLREVCQLVRQQETNGNLSKWRVNHFNVDEYADVEVTHRFRRGWKVLIITHAYAQTN